MKFIWGKRVFCQKAEGEKVIVASNRSPET